MMASLCYTQANRTEPRGGYAHWIDDVPHVCISDN